MLPFTHTLPKFRDESVKYMTEHDITQELRKFGWIVPVYNMPPNAQVTRHWVL